MKTPKIIFGLTVWFRRHFRFFAGSAPDLPPVLQSLQIKMASVENGGLSGIPRRNAF